MTLKNFQHISATSLKEATALLAKANGKAAVIAGGTDLLGALKDKIHSDSPEMLIDLKTIPQLSYVKEDRKGLRIGALTPLLDIMTNQTVKEKYQLLADAARSVASPQIRNMGTIGGNICQEPRCWYYRTPDNLFHCLRKGGDMCGALLGENRYHSIFGSVRVAQPACSQTCPGNIEIPAYMSYIRNGDTRSAASVILANNPIPAITGRVCPHFCESECNRVAFDEAVSIRNVERVVGDFILDHAKEFLTPPKKESKKRVAIVGSGPAGLSAAYYLRKGGYQVTVFEKMPAAGGMLTYCIPSYRLPKEVVQKQIQAFKAMGIKFKVKARVGRKGLTLQDLRKQFTHVFLATGAWVHRGLDIDKSELLTSGLEFLVKIGSGDLPAVGKNVLVIGGGNVAVDVAISAKRLGAKQVTMVCLECREEMPAFTEEMEQAVKEGVTFLPSFGPHRIIEKRGRIAGLELVRCTSVFDDACLFNPSFDHSEKQTIDADQIILAIGQSTDLSFADETLETRRGLIVIDEQTRKTSAKGVFAGGDVVSGPASVIHAIAAGRKAAFCIANVKPALAVGIGQPLEMDSNFQTKSERTKQLTCMDDIGCEAARCINCGCVAVNASDMAPALIALGANIVTTKRTLEAEQFFKARVMKSTVLDDDELVKEIAVPSQKPSIRQGYRKFRIRNSIDFPIVSLAYRLHTDGHNIKGARIVLGAVASVPLRMPSVESAVEGKSLSEETAKTIGELAVEQVLPLSKNAFKVQVVKGLLRKMLLDSGLS